MTEFAESPESFDDTPNEMLLDNQQVLGGTPTEDSEGAQSNTGSAWKMQDSRWEWDGGEFPPRLLFSWAAQTSAEPEAPPILLWNSEQGKYEASDDARFSIATIDLSSPTESDEARIAAAQEHLYGWAEWTRENNNLFSAEMGSELPAMADNILDDLRGDSGYAAFAYDNTDTLQGVSIHEVLKTRSPSEGDFEGDPFPAATAGVLTEKLGGLDKPYLYAAYSVAHPSSQVNVANRAAGTVGGAGSALREMRSSQSAKWGIPIVTSANNSRSYLQNLKAGFNDIDEPIEGVFPPPEEMLKSFGTTQSGDGGGTSSRGQTQADPAAQYQQGGDGQEREPGPPTASKRPRDESFTDEDEDEDEDDAGPSKKPSVAVAAPETTGLLEETRNNAPQTDLEIQANPLDPVDNAQANFGDAAQTDSLLAGPGEDNLATEATETLDTQEQVAPPDPMPDPGEDNLATEASAVAVSAAPDMPEMAE